jgi:hypothetical protein
MKAMRFAGIRRLICLSSAIPQAVERTAKGRTLFSTFALLGKKKSTSIL